MAQSLKDIIDGLSLTTGLKLCLDAGDSASYNPSVQTAKWLDTSGNGYDFYRGNSATADPQEPTFNGSAGGLSPSEYWSFDGGDYFTYDATNEAWMDNLHKDGSTFSLVAAFYRNSGSDLVRIFTTGSNNTAIGCRILISATSILNFIIANGSASQTVLQATTAVNSSGWTVLGLSYDENTGNWVSVINGSVDSGTQTFTAPSASNASMVARIGVQVGVVGANTANTRQSLQAMWEGVALTSSQLTDLYNEINQRFNPVINPGLFSNTNIFYSPTVTQATSTQTLIHNRYDNDNTFYAPAVSVGAVTLRAGLFTNGNTFYQPTVNRGAVALSASLYSNTNAFYAANVTLGAVNLNPELFTNTNEFYGHTLDVGTVNIAPDLFVNVNEFYQSNVTVGAVTLTASLFENTNAVYQHNVSVVTPNQNLIAELFVNANKFYAPNLQVGVITLSLEIFVNHNELYAPSITNVFGQNLIAELFVNANVFYGVNIDFAKYAYARRDSSITNIEMRENVQTLNRENSISSTNRKLSVSFRQPNVVKSRR